MSAEGGPPRRRGRRFAGTAVALAGWAGLILVAHVLGDHLVHREPRTRIFAAPLVATLDPHVHAAVLVPLVVGVLAVAFAWRLSMRLTWPRLLLVVFVAAGAWAVSLALIDGVGELTRPLLGASDYIHDVPLVAGPGPFLSHFVEGIGAYHQHVRAHPPGMVLLLWALGRVGLGGVGWEAALEIAGGAATVPAALVALRAVAGERSVRAAAPFVAFAPVAIWVATSGDALFAGVSTWAVALVILAVRRSDRRGDALALGGGLLFGAALMLSYGAAPVAVVPAVVAMRFRRLRPLVVAAAGAGAVLVGFGAAGFWWASGLMATARQYRASVSRLRPQGYFWLGNLGAFAIALGPATVVGLARLRDRGTWLLMAGGIVAVALADATGLSKGEVERIWLPFAPWILLAGSALAGSAPGWARGIDLPVPGCAQDEPHVERTSARTWLGVTLCVGLALQLLLRTTW